MSVPDTEYKFLPAGECGLSLKSDEGRPVAVHGYASTFMGEPDSYGDLIAPGAYARTIKGWRGKGLPLPFLLEHDGAPIGKWVELREDDKGLWVEGELTPGHSVASDVAASLKHGALSGLSIGFRCKKFSIDHQAKTRILEDIDLYEVSAVANPANETARIAAVKAAMRTSVQVPDVPAAVGHLRRAKAMLAPHVKAVQPIADACQGAHDAVGAAMEALGVKPPKAMQLRELQQHLRETFGVSRREAEEIAERLVKARVAGDGDEPEGDVREDGADGDGRRGDTTPRDEGPGADLLAAIRAVSIPKPSWISR